MSQPGHLAKVQYMLAAILLIAVSMAVLVSFLFTTNIGSIVAPDHDAALILHGKGQLGRPSKGLGSDTVLNFKYDFPHTTPNGAKSCQELL